MEEEYQENPETGRIEEETTTSPAEDKSFLLEILIENRNNDKQNFYDRLREYGINDYGLSYLRRRVDAHINSYTALRNFHGETAARDIMVILNRIGKTLGTDLYANAAIYEIYEGDIKSIVYDILHQVNNDYWGSYTGKRYSLKQILSESTQTVQKIQEETKKKSGLLSFFGL